DAFNLLLGRSPGDITGAMEGLLLGGAVGFGVWFGARGGRSPWHRRSVFSAAAAGAVAGLVVPLLGGRLMAGSLDLLAQTFPNSRLRLDQLGTLFGDTGFGIASQMASGALEGALFAACVTAAMAGFAPLLTTRPRAAAPTGLTARRQPRRAARSTTPARNPARRRRPPAHTAPSPHGSPRPRTARGPCRAA